MYTILPFETLNSEQWFQRLCIYISFIIIVAGKDLSYRCMHVEDGRVRLLFTVLDSLINSAGSSNLHMRSSSTISLGKCLPIALILANEHVFYAFRRVCGFGCGSHRQGWCISPIFKVYCSKTHLAGLQTAYYHTRRISDFCLGSPFIK